MHRLPPALASSCRARILALAAAATLAACASDTPRPTLLSVPALAAAAPAAVAAAASAAGEAPVLVVRRVVLPEYLTTRRVRFRAEPSTLAEWPNTYWAERVEISASREFTMALRRALPGWTVCEGTCGDRAASLALVVEISPLDFVRSARQTQARARAELSAAQGEARLLGQWEQGFEVAASGDSAMAQAEGLAVLLGRVAQAIAPMVQQARP